MPESKLLLKIRQMLRSLQIEPSQLFLKNNRRSHYPALPVMEPEFAVHAAAAAMGLAVRNALSAMVK